MMFTGDKLVSSSIDTLLFSQNNNSGKRNNTREFVLVNGIHGVGFRNKSKITGKEVEEYKLQI